MALTIKILENANEKAWDDVILSSSHGTIFHTIAWLRLAQEQSNTELLPLMFYKGIELVAIYPVFIQKQGIIKVALSPPSRSYMLYLGPVLADYDSLKQDKKESIYLQVQQELDKYLFETKGCRYARIRSSPGLYDSRPLKWSGYTINPYYTYRIDLAGELIVSGNNLTGNSGWRLTEAVREGVTVRTGDEEDLEFIHDSLFTRYRNKVSGLLIIKNIYTLFTKNFIRTT